MKSGFYSSPRFSPDSRKIALVDSFQRLWYVDLEVKKQVEVAQDHYQMRNGAIVGAWSPDSKWLAYSKVLPNHFSAINVFSVAQGTSRQITDGMSDALNPVFDKEGKYLFFTASTNSGESLGLDLRGPASSPTSSIYLVVLDKTIPSPFAPESDEEKAADDALAPSDGSQVARPPESAKSKPAADVKIDFDSIDQRIVAVPLPPRRYVELQAGKAGTLLALAPTQDVESSPSDGPPPAPSRSVYRYDLKMRKSDTPLTGVVGFQMSAGGEKALYRQGDNWIIAALRAMPNGSAPGGPPPATPPAGVLKTAGIEVRVDPPRSGNRCSARRGESSATGSTTAMHTDTISPRDRGFTSATCLVSPRATT